MKEHPREMTDFVCPVDSASYTAIECAICENCDLGYANSSDLAPAVPLCESIKVNIAGTKGTVSCTVYVSKEKSTYKLSVYNITVVK